MESLYDLEQQKFEDILSQFIDIEDNLIHYKYEHIICHVDFKKAYQRKKIVSTANIMYKVGFERFLLKTQENENHIKELKNAKDYFNFYCIEDAPIILSKLYFHKFLDASPSLEYYSDSFKDILAMMRDKSFSITINENDLLPRKPTRWDNEQKLFSFLLARKRYLYECWQYFLKQATRNKLNNDFFCKMTFKKVVILTNYLVSNEYLAPTSSHCFIKVIFGLSNVLEGSRFLSPIQRFEYSFFKVRSIQWLSNCRAITLLFFFLFRYGFLNCPTKYEKVISWKDLDWIFETFIDKRNKFFNKHTFRRHYKEFENDIEIYNEIVYLDEKEESFCNFIKNLKLL